MMDISLCPLNMLPDDGLRRRLAGESSFTDYYIVAEWSSLPEGRWIITAPEAICSIPLISIFIPRAYLAVTPASR